MWWERKCGSHYPPHPELLIGASRRLGTWLRPLTCDCDLISCHRENNTKAGVPWTLERNGDSTSYLMGRWFVDAARYTQGRFTMAVHCKTHSIVILLSRQGNKKGFHYSSYCLTNLFSSFKASIVLSYKICQQLLKREDKEAF